MGIRNINYGFIMFMYYTITYIQTMDFAKLDLKKEERKRKRKRKKKKKKKVWGIE